MHILSPETDNCPSWISGRERMTVENISWSISTNECCRPRRGLNPRPPGRQSEAHPNEPRGRQVLRSRHPIWFYSNTNKRFLVYFNTTDCVWKSPETRSSFLANFHVIFNNRKPNCICSHECFGQTSIGVFFLRMVTTKPTDNRSFWYVRNTITYLYAAYPIILHTT